MEEKKYDGLVGCREKTFDKFNTFHDEPSQQTRNRRKCPQLDGDTLPTRNITRVDTTLNSLPHN